MESRRFEIELESPPFISCIANAWCAVCCFAFYAQTAEKPHTELRLQFLCDLLHFGSYTCNPSLGHLATILCTHLYAAYQRKSCKKVLGISIEFELCPSKFACAVLNLALLCSDGNAAAKFHRLHRFCPRFGVDRVCANDAANFHRC